MENSVRFWVAVVILNVNLLVKMSIVLKAKDILVNGTLKYITANSPLYTILLLQLVTVY